LFGRHGLSGVRERGIQGVPAKTGALHPRGELAYPRQCCKLAKAGEVDIGIMLREQRMDLVEQATYFLPRLALDRFGEQRSRGNRNGAAATFELGCSDAVAVEADVQGQPIATQRVGSRRVAVGSFELAEITGIAVV